MTTIGRAAFYKAGPSVTISQLPSLLTSIGQNAFAFLSAITINEFGSDESGKGLKTIGQQAFYRSGENVTSVYFYKSLAAEGSNIDKSAFEDFGELYGSNIKIYVSGQADNYPWFENDEAIARIGFENITKEEIQSLE